MNVHEFEDNYRLFKACTRFISKPICQELKKVAKRISSRIYKCSIFVSSKQKALLSSIYIIIYAHLLCNMNSQKTFITFLSSGFSYLRGGDLKLPSLIVPQPPR